MDNLSNFRDRDWSAIFIFENYTLHFEVNSKYISEQCPVLVRSVGKFEIGVCLKLYSVKNDSFGVPHSCPLFSFPEAEVDCIPISSIYQIFKNKKRFFPILFSLHF